MRIRSMAVILGMVLCAAGPLAASGSGSGFERLKSLEGTWRGKAPDGAPVTVTYKVIAAGSAVMEQLSVENMITVYHADGDNLMLTHYCAGNNQPRMRASAAGQDGSVLSFHFVDATNLA
ncbi:MAG TPA: hypothetical protein VFP98_04325, partial [Candidatus Polarisedimenticolia bacterium]|nr:hypothetical protein [Candidatus Polarisedimenticolia bacterium]